MIPSVAYGRVNVPLRHELNYIRWKGDAKMISCVALYDFEFYMVVSNISRWYRYTISPVSIRFMSFLQVSQPQRSQDLIASTQQKLKGKSTSVTISPNSVERKDVEIDLVRGRGLHGGQQTGRHRCYSAVRN